MPERRGWTGSALPECFSAWPVTKRCGLLREGGCWEPALASLTGKIGEHLARFGGESLETGTIVYSKEYGILGMSENARELLEKCKEGASWCIL